MNGTNSTRRTVETQSGIFFEIRPGVWNNAEGDIQPVGEYLVRADEYLHFDADKGVFCLNLEGAYEFEETIVPTPIAEDMIRNKEIEKIGEGYGTTFYAPTALLKERVN